jgi:predicted O-methyltransferase YrrM
LNDPTAIDVYDVGTGGASGHVFSTYPPTTGADGRQAPLTIRRQIQQIASRALKPAPQAQLLFRMCARLGYKKVLELGTSLGITTLYLSAASKQITCTSVEGCPNIASIASKTLLKHGYHNANIVNTNLNSGLLNLLNNIGIQDIIFIDANHSYQALTDYFNQCVNFIHTNSIIVVDDPYWSREMTKAWNELRRHNKVTATLDIYHMGFVFFNPAFANKHYRIRF